jgi:hypothetical protein
MRVFLSCVDWPTHLNVCPSRLQHTPTHPLQACAEELARKDDWPQLYDPQALRGNEVPCAVSA